MHSQYYHYYYYYPPPPFHARYYYTRHLSNWQQQPSPFGWWTLPPPLPPPPPPHVQGPGQRTTIASSVAPAAPVCAAATPPVPYRAKHVFCHNCGDVTHSSNRCELPIMSYGAIAFRIRPTDGRREYLMICRRHSLGYLDFMRGRLPHAHPIRRTAAEEEQPPQRSSSSFPPPIVAMIAQMTREERGHLVAMARDPPSAALMHNALLKRTVAPAAGSSATNAADRVAAWIANVAREEEPLLREQHETPPTDAAAPPPLPHLLERMVLASDAVQQWDEPEWGFPKGKRNTMESDWACALREFSEETGLPGRAFLVVPPPPGLQDAEPWPQEARCAANRMGRAVRETFRGSNYKRYAHRYLLLTPPTTAVADMSIVHFQTWEVSDMQWFTVEEACSRIRPYNHEKLLMLQRLDAALDDADAAASAVRI